MKKLVFFTGLFVALSCFAQYSGGGGYSGGGNASISGDVTNGNLIVSSGGRTFVDAGVAPYDPNILIAMIGTNSSAIDNIYGTNAVYVVATDSATQNGTNLLAVATDGGTETIIVTEGTYTLPSALAIVTNPRMITTLRSHDCTGGIVSGPTDTPKPPPVSPVAVINGDVTFSTDTLESIFCGFEVNGDIDVNGLGTPERGTPTVIKNCYIKGNINEGIACYARIEGCSVEGNVANGGTWQGSVDGLVISGGTNFTLTGSSKGPTHLFDRMWIHPDASSFPGKTGANLWFRDCRLKGDLLFSDDGGGASDVRMERCDIYDASATTWDGLVDSTDTAFNYTTGISTAITNHSNSAFLYSSDSGNNPIE